MEHMNDWLNTVINTLGANLDKLILLVAVTVIALIADRTLSKLLRRALDKSNIPSASIFVNLMRVLI